MRVADLIENHHYSSGKPFFIVVCDQCHAALNSGHHYSDRDLPHAVKLAADHIAEHHAAWEIELGPQYLAYVIEEVTSR